MTTILRACIKWLQVNVLQVDYNSADGDQNQILYDADGSVTGVPQSYIIRPKDPLMMTSSCSVNSQNISFCTNVQYGQVLHLHCGGGDTNWLREQLTDMQHR